MHGAERHNAQYPILSVLALAERTKTKFSKRSRVTMAELTPDWILHETLAVQRQALMDFVNGKAVDKGLTLTVLGCGEEGYQDTA